MAYNSLVRPSLSLLLPSPSGPVLYHILRIIPSFCPAKVKTFEFFEYDRDGKLILLMYRVSAGKIFP
jgi:hypothetical protein